MNKKLDQRGAVAIISVVIFATIISVLITAYLRSAVVSQQQSTNYDLSTRAFYSAESGVQDTIREIRLDSSKLADKNTCSPFSNSNPDFNAPDFGLSYNCQLITITPTKLTGEVIPNEQYAMIRLEPNAPVASDPKLVVRWSDQVQAGSTKPVLYPRGGASKQFKPFSNWLVGANPSKPIHPPLEVTVIDHPIEPDSFARSDINQRKVFLNPTKASNNNDGEVNFKKAANSVATQQDQLFNNAKCYESNEASIPPEMDSYSCMETIDIKGYLFTDSAVYVRVGSIYGATNFSLELIDGVNPVSLKNSQALIDITGKAGDRTYRRVQQAVPLSNFQIQYGPGAAIVAGEGICKQLVLGNDTSVFTSNTGCNPLTD